MFPYDDVAGAVLRTAGDEARRLRAPGYDTRHVLQALLRTGDPVTQRITGQESRLTAEAVHEQGLAGEVTGSAQPSPRAPGPGPEFREAMSRFTATWRPLVRARLLRPGPRLGTAELWLTVLEPGTRSGQALRALGVEPDTIRDVVLATMVPEGRPIPAWPGEVPVGTVRRLVGRLLGRGARA